MEAPVIIDADVAIRLANFDAFAALAHRRMFAPRLFWTECCSVLHRARRRRASSDGRERISYERILGAPIELVDDYDRRAPWDIASILGWHKTYDSEYLAAARHLGAGVCTFDQQLAEGARRLGIPVVAPA